jgi:hypothetical protein
MYNPIMANTPYSIMPIFPETEVPERDAQPLEDIVDDPCILQSQIINDFDIKTIADRISSKLVKIVEQQLQEQE